MVGGRRGQEPVLGDSFGAEVVGCEVDAARDKRGAKKGD